MSEMKRLLLVGGVILVAVVGVIMFAVANGASRAPSSPPPTVELTNSCTVATAAYSAAQSAAADYYASNHDASGLPSPTFDRRVGVVEQGHFQVAVLPGTGTNVWGHPHNLKPEDEEAAKKLVAEWEAEASAANPARAIKESLKR